MKKGKLRKFLFSTVIGLMALVVPLLSTGCSISGDVDVRLYDGYVQWTVEGTDNWKNLLTVDEIKDMLGEGYKGEQGNPGINGKQVEFRKSETHIQWRYVTESNSEEWSNLVAISELKGDKGDEGNSGANGTTPHIGENGNWWIGTLDTNVKAEGTDGDTPTISISGDGYWIINDVKQSVKAVGTDGINGKQVEFRKDNAYVQWRYVGDSDWTNLFELEDVKGDKGDPGDDGLTPYIGENGNWWIGEEDTGIKTMKSIYDIYCENKPNYKKTESEWINDFLTGELLLLPTKLGDVNLSGMFDGVDWRLLNFYLSEEETLSEKQLANADLNADGVVNQTDSKLMGISYLFSIRLGDSQEVLKEFPILEPFGDIDLDSDVDEDDYILLSKADNNEVELTLKQNILAHLSNGTQYTDSLGLLRDYLDGKINDLNYIYNYITLDFDGYENIGNVETYFYVKKGDCIRNLPMITCEGLTFNGWIPSYETAVNSGTIITVDTPIEKSMTLIPSFTDSRANVSQNLDFEIKTGKTYSLTGLGTNADTELVIPAYYNGLKVTSLAGLSQTNEIITSIFIPKMINSIASGYQSSFKNLEHIVVDENNTIYDSRENCNAVIETKTNTLVMTCKNTIIPSSVTTIGAGAYQGITLGELDLPENISKLSEMSFSSSNIAKIVIRNVDDVICETGWTGILFGSKITTVICDNKDLANYTNYEEGDLKFGICPGMSHDLETLYFKEGLTINTEFYWQFEQVESDLEGYVKYQLKEN